MIWCTMERFHAGEMIDWQFSSEFDGIRTRKTRAKINGEDCLARKKLAIKLLITKNLHLFTF